MDFGTLMQGTVVSLQTLDLKAVNEYQAVGSAEIVASKRVENFTLEEGQFSFDLYLVEKEQNGTTVVPEDSSTPIQTALNKADGSVTFEAVNFSAKDIGAVYTYKVIERDQRKQAFVPDGWTEPTEDNPYPERWENILYDRHEATVKVKVSDNGDTTLKTEIVYDDPDAGAVFKNIISRKGNTGKEPKNTFRVRTESGNVPFS